MQQIVTERSNGGNNILLHYKFIQSKLGLNDNQLYIAMCRGRSGDSWKCKKINGEWYFDYDSIPNRKPNYYRDQLPGIADLVSYNKPKQLVQELLVDKLNRHV